MWNLKRAPLIAALGIVVWLGASAEAVAAKLDFGRYYALVIGINHYANLPRLATAVNDASAVHDILSNRFGFDSTLLLNPTRYDLVRALDKIRATLTDRDNLVIYYAGHGVLDGETEEGFWLPIDAEEDSQANWVSVSTVTRTLQASAARHALVIADSCYSGVLTRSAPALLPTGAERMIELQRLIGKRSRKAMTSGGLEPVNDGGGDGHSIFTRALVRTLQETNEPIEGYQLYSRLRRIVVLNAEQTPQYSDIRMAGDEGGDFVFVPRGAVQVATAEIPRVGQTPTGQVERPPPDLYALDLTFWNSVKDSDNPALYQAYLDQFPNGAFVPLAKIRLAEFQRRPAAAEKTRQGTNQTAVIAPPRDRPAAKPEPAVRRLQVGKACRQRKQYWTKGSGADWQVVLYRPEPPERDYYVVGGYVQRNYAEPKGCVTVVREAGDGGAGPPLLARPVDWKRVWNDKRSGSYMDGSIWQAVPPNDTYVCLGSTAVNGYHKPRIENYACVHICLTRRIEESKLIWWDRGSGAKHDVSLYRVPNAGTYLARKGYQRWAPVYDLKDEPSCTFD